MKRWIAMLAMAAAVAVPFASLGQTQNNVWTGNADDGDFNNAANWWNSVTPNDNCFFRGDNVADHPARTNANLSAPATITRLNFQGSVLATAAYNITGTGGTLTIDAQAENNTVQLIDVFNAVEATQTLAADVVLKTASNALTYHIRTGTGAGLVFSGTLSQDAASQGVGIGVGNGDIEISGDVDGSGKLWRVARSGAATTGVLKLAGEGVWSGFGTVQIAANVKVLLARETADSTGFAPGVLQIQSGGTLALGNDEQILDAIEPSFNGIGGILDLNGHEETVRLLKFNAATDTGTLAMGDGGVLRLSNQNPAATWGSLTILEWDEGVDHIYVMGGSFSDEQLAAIAFDGWEPAGAKVEGGELLPTGNNVAKTAYENWADDYGVGAPGDDDDGDGLVNLYEYGLGGDPTNSADLGYVPSNATLEQGGTTWFEYVHARRTAPDSGLAYTLEQNNDLVYGTWTNTGDHVVGTGALDADFESVTNRIPTTGKNKEFVRLVIGLDE